MTQKRDRKPGDFGYGLQQAINRLEDTADSGSPARFECVTCGHDAEGRRRSPHHYTATGMILPDWQSRNVHDRANHDVRPAEVRR